MIEGAVNAARQAVVGLLLRGPSDSTPLVGMSLLAGHRLCADIEDGGRVVIEASA